MTDTNTGWKLVPLVPTPEMMEQYQHAFVSAERFDGAKVYRAMVDAAPLPEEPEVGEAMEMALCERHSVVLREGQLYRFVRVEDCEKCAKMSADSLECYGPPPTATVEAQSEDRLGKLQIDVEKLLCDILGRPWAPVGFSIETLCAEIKAKIAEGQPKPIWERGAEMGWRRECADTDDLLKFIGLDPEVCRTEGGWLNMPRIKTGLEETALGLILGGNEQPTATCPNCDGTGDVHSRTGEWRGRCHCPAGRAEPAASEVEGLISSTWFANRPAVLDAIREAGMTLEHYNGVWKLRPLRDGW